MLLYARGIWEPYQIVIDRCILDNQNGTYNYSKFPFGKGHLYFLQLCLGIHNKSCTKLINLYNFVHKINDNTCHTSYNSVDEIDKLLNNFVDENYQGFTLSWTKVIVLFNFLHKIDRLTQFRGHN